MCETTLDPNSAYNKSVVPTPPAELLAARRRPPPDYKSRSPAQPGRSMSLWLPSGQASLPPPAVELDDDTTQFTRATRGGAVH